eukprot:tig00000718_g3686.t1
MRCAAPSPTEAALRVLRAPSPGFRMDLHAPRSGRPPNPSVRSSASSTHIGHQRSARIAMAPVPQLRSDAARCGSTLRTFGSGGGPPVPVSRGQSVAGTGEPPGTARTFDPVILSP